MKALVYHGPGRKAWEEVPDPRIKDPNDVIVRVETTTICGTDLHILRGDVAGVEPGRVLGHEAIGSIVETGAGVAKFRVGERVIVSTTTTCGTCSFCRRGHPSHCQSVGGLGWILGHLVDGTQAEYVRVPFGETSLHPVPPGLPDEELIFMSDVIPTGYERGVLDSGVQPGDDVVVIGAGPVGLAAMTTARLFGPRRIIGVDINLFRLDMARKHFGATHAVDSGHPGWIDEVRACCHNGAADVVIEAVGIPETLEAAFTLVRPTGHVANLGVHGKPVSLPIERLWMQNITVTTGMVDCVATPVLIALVEAGKFSVKELVTHRFPLDRMIEAYEVFNNAAANHALKVVLHI